MLDRRTREVSVAGCPVELTAKEFDLLSALLEDPGAVVRREDLMARVWNANWFGSTKTLDVHVASLRRKLGAAGWVETVRGVGFRAVPVRCAAVWSARSWCRCSRRSCCSRCRCWS